MELRKCRNCEHCVWLNRWRCSLDRWEFDVWIGSCSEFENKKPLGEDKYGK